MCIRDRPCFQHVIATQDWHPADHSSFASQHADNNIGDVISLCGLDQVLWPNHCVQGTSGGDFAEQLNRPADIRVFRKGTDSSIDSYSGFFDNGHRKSTGLEQYLDELDIKRVYVMGLATDYCVKFTVLDALKLGLETYLVEDGCRGVNLQPTDVVNAIEEMRQAGAQVVGSESILNERKESKK